MQQLAQFLNNLTRFSLPHIIYKSFFYCNLYFIVLIFICPFISCNYFNSDSPALFSLLSPDDTGIDFNNKITENEDFNSLKFDYIYNGGGVAAGDINNDGLEDLFFTGNMVSGELYLNKGGLKFEKITKSAGVSTSKWTTGVSMVDINSDGWLDIYICVAGPANQSDYSNLLYINNKNNTFTESAHKYGLDDKGYSTHSAFLDYDMDGDLDMYLLTNAIEKFNRNLKRPKELTGNGLSTDRLYRNNGNNTFSNVSKEAGITIEGYGLGVCVSDINKDGWPDIYVANDFISNDLLWINNQNGTFSNKISTMLKHQSFNSMGTDIADLNNDGLAEIMVLDMLPEDNLRQKTMLLPGNYDTFGMNLKLGYEPQYVRNSLQLNNGNGTYSEIGQLAGVSKTDWSWGPLFADFDNDGFRDILVTNGYRRDVTNLDFIVNTETENNPFGDPKIQKAEFYERFKKVKDVKIHNYIYQNNHDLTFTDKSKLWGLDQPSYSNGGVYVDLDNDGDLDLAINNIDDNAFIYRNNSEKKAAYHYLTIKFKGSASNPFGIGSSVTIEMPHSNLTYEHYTHKGYKSTVDSKAHFGLGKDSLIKQLVITWPDKKQQIIKNVKANQTLIIDYKSAVAETINATQKIKPLFTEVSKNYNLNFTHQETEYKDFVNQSLLPRKYSQDGPGMAAGDVNNDGMEDFYVGGSTNHPGTLFIQRANGKFISKPLFGDNKPQEDMGVLFFDADADKDLDLYVVSGGNEYPENSDFYQDRLYKNDGKGNFTLDESALPALKASGSCVIAADFDKDNDLDLFVGGRIVPNKYPLPAQSSILRNDGGKFVDVTDAVAQGLKNIGLVSSALWTDFNNDNQIDLIVVGEWMPLSFFANIKGRLINVTNKTTLQNTEGWWNSITSGDFDNDGDTDYIAGNLGLNSKYKASNEEPVSICAKDYDKNGTLDPILCLYVQGKEHPTHPRDELIFQIPALRKRLYSYSSYGESTFDKIFSKEEMEGAFIVKAKKMSSVNIENLGGGKFRIKDLPLKSQFSPVYGMLVKDYDGDNLLDVLLTGNSYATEVLTGWYDAMIGLYLKGDGKGGFAPVTVNQSGFMVKDDGKSLIELVSKNGQSLLVAATNSGPLSAFESTISKSYKSVVLNLDDSYGLMTFKDGKKQRCEFYYGNGYLSQSSRVLKVPKEVSNLTIYSFKGNSRSVNLSN